MGTVIHRTLVVTGAQYGKNIDSDSVGIEDVYNKALMIMSEKSDGDGGNLADLVSGLHGGMNSTFTFMVATTGSKEGWEWLNSN